MEHRLGTCGSCQARFKIPASFTPNRARCRRCNGVVEIGPLVSDPHGSPVIEARAGHEFAPQANGGARPPAPPRRDTPAVRQDAPIQSVPTASVARDEVREPKPAPVIEHVASTPAPELARDSRADFPRAAQPARTLPAERPAARAKSATKPTRKRWIPVLVGAVVLALAAFGMWAMSERRVVSETQAAPEPDSQASTLEKDGTVHADSDHAVDPKPAATPGSTDEHGARGN